MHFIRYSHRRAIRLGWLPLVLCMSLAPAVAQEIADADEAAWLQAEFIVFRQLDTSSAADEAWPAEPVLGYSTETRILTAPDLEFQAAPAAPADSSDTSGFVREPAFVLLPPEQRQMQDIASRLASSSNYRVLQHQAWRQPLPSSNQPTHVLLTGGRAIGEHFELEGYVSILRSNFLHVETHLWLNDFAADAALSNGPVLPPVPAPPSNPQGAANSGESAAGDRFMPATIETTAVIGSDAVDADAPSATELHAERAVLLQESRRVRLGERHYIDHPLFGVIVTLRAYDPNLAPTAEAPAGLPVSP